MSRRHQGGRSHRPGGHGRPSAAPLAAPSPDAQRHRPEAIEPGRLHAPVPDPSAPLAGQPLSPFALPQMSPTLARPETTEPTSEGPPPDESRALKAASPVPSPDAPESAPPLSATSSPFSRPPLNRPGLPSDGGHGPLIGATCTAPQLRRFIKSRPYVPMHELRRRFAINGDDDDVTAVDLAQGRVFVGLPAREGDLLGELLRGGEVGYELSLDPRSPIVIGLYPMRPIPRS
jgi:hypothetical protein